MLSLICPVSGNRLERMERSEFDDLIGEPSMLLRTTGLELGDPRFPTATEVLVDRASSWAYPMIDGVPILLSPERLGPESLCFELDLQMGVFAEAYAEMAHYNKVAEAEIDTVRTSPSFDAVASIGDAANATDFPSRHGGWLDAAFDCVPQYEAYLYVRPEAGDRFLQVGGKGTHAVKFLIAGCGTACVMSPMLGEALFTRALAREFGRGDDLEVVVAMAEELPFADDSFDLAYSGGSLHHTDTSSSLPEIARVLRDGGRFSSVDMWDAPLYSRLIGMFGKRECGIECKPLNPERVRPLHEHFATSGVQQHGAFSRYAVFAFQRAGIDVNLDRVWSVTQFDDRLASKIPRARSLGSAVVTTGRA